MSSMFREFEKDVAIKIIQKAITRVGLVKDIASPLSKKAASPLYHVIII